tara:strand:- start:2799 stop:3605 length:807 start_codon:yes stop_codon:yes gene_type:complete
MTTMNRQEPPTDLHPSPQPSWTPEKQREFLEALARCGSVKAAAAYVGMSREGAYRLRRRPEGCAFDRAWDAALIHARDLYAETLLETGLHGWTEAVWYHGEEVGERTRFSPGLLLAALARLDAKAEGIDMAGEAARVAAADFETMVEAIGEGDDCAAMLAQQDETARARRTFESRSSRSEPSDEELLAQLEMCQQRDLIFRTPPEDIDTSDLDPYQAANWDELQWARAERSGMMGEPDFWAKVDPEGIYDDDDDDRRDRADPNIRPFR